MENTGPGIETEAVTSETLDTIAPKLKNIRFGIETEAVTREKFDAIASSIRSAGIEGVLVQTESPDDPTPNLNVYIVKSDASIDSEISVSDKNARARGVEIASAVMLDNAQTRPIWHTQFSRVMRVPAVLAMWVRECCGVHVHISPGCDGQWTLIQLQKGSMLYILYEGQIDKMHPAHRLTNSWCKSNKMAAKFYRHPVAKCLDIIQQTRCIQELQNSMSPDRNFKMNLRSLDQHSTIEFRQHEGTLDPDAICAWVDFLLDFVRKAQSFSFDEIKQLDPNVDTLIPHIVASGPRFLRP